MFRDNKYLIPIMLIVGVIIWIIGGTLAYWNWQSSTAQKTEVTFTVGSNFSCGANGGGNITNSTYFAPTTCDNSTYALKRTITTSITNNGTDPVYMDLWLNVVSMGEGLRNSDNFKYALTTSESSCTTGVEASGTFKGKADGSKVELLSGATSGSTYYLYIWLDAAEESPDTMNQSVNLTLGGECTNEAQTSSLPSFITESNAPLDSVNSTYVQNSTPGIDFTKISSDTNGKGLYIRSGTENNANPIYYYRGAVENNNVYFGGFCWKIVRTTETGGLKMIYNGTPSSDSCGSGTTSQTNSSIGNYKFNTNYDDAKYVGYMYDTNTSSTIKTAIDTWYQTNLLTNYASYLEDTIFCNDRSVANAADTSTIKSEWGYSESNEGTFYNSIVRVMNGSPSLSCPNSADAFTVENSNGNGKLTYPVGLLTMDEIWLAGVGLDGLNGDRLPALDGYLYTDYWWWSLSPNGFESGNANVWTAGPDGGLDGGTVGFHDGARPVVSLKPGQNFEYGNGTVGNPYRFVATVS